MISNHSQSSTSLLTSILHNTSEFQPPASTSARLSHRSTAGADQGDPPLLTSVRINVNHPGEDHLNDAGTLSLSPSTRTKFDRRRTNTPNSVLAPRNGAVAQSKPSSPMKSAAAARNLNPNMFALLEKPAPIFVPMSAPFPAARKLHKLSSHSSSEMMMGNMNKKSNDRGDNDNVTRTNRREHIAFSRGLVDIIHTSPTQRLGKDHMKVNGSVQWEVFVSRNQSARLQPLTRQSFRSHLGNIDRINSFLMTSRALTKRC